jgi:hypothetical protein
MATSKWHKITNIVDDNKAGQYAANGDWVGKGGHVFKECTLTLNGTGNAFTEHFDFPIMGDLTIVVNSNGADIDNNYPGANCKVTVQGSVDGTSWVDLDTSSAFTGGVTIDGKAQMHLYDYDEEGRMPYMRLKMVGNGTGTNDIKIAVIPH